MASPRAKKLKMENPEEKSPVVPKSVYERFSTEVEMISELKSSFDLLFHLQSAALESLTILKCNADFGGGRYGQPFSKAYVEVKDNYKDKIFLFGSVFLPGFNLLDSYLQDPKLAPSERHSDFILSKLLTFLMDKDNEKVLQCLGEDIKLESDLAVRLAEHLFSKLSVASSYTIDEYYPGKVYNCRCGCFSDIIDHYGDTSLGNPKVWHGSLDIILDSQAVGVAIPVDSNDDVDSSLGGKSMIEVKVMPNLEHPDAASQLIAQTIVFSFAQKKKHPEYKKFLFPIVGINSKMVIFHFYDSEHDILLKSRVFPIFERNKLNYDAILAIWLVVNYKYLCSGSTKEIKNEAEKANFFQYAGSQLPIYKNELKMGGISRKDVHVMPFNPGNIPRPQMKNLHEILAEETEEGISAIGI